MVISSGQLSKKEIRSIGDCPWCGKGGAALRDYMCYEATRPCCHSLFRKLQPKMHLAIREFPNRKVNVETQFDLLVQKFHHHFMEDKRLLADNEELITKIDTYLQEYNSDIKELLEFLVRLYIIRGAIPIKTESDFLRMHCIVCGREFSDTWSHEICSLCMENVGKPQGGGASSPKPTSNSPSQSRSTGMHIRKNR